MTVEEARQYGWGDRAEAFVAWRAKVNAALIRLCTLGIDDLPDIDYASKFEAGEDPEDVARELLLDEGWEEDMLD